LEGVDLPRNRQVIRDGLHPVPRDVHIDVLPESSDPRLGLLAIEIPPQAARRCCRSLSDEVVSPGRIRTEHFALPVRGADGMASWELAEMDSLIVACRAALGALTARSETGFPESAE
jgi:hypothetical protein